MIKQNYENIKNNFEIKENLQAIKDDLKDVNKGSRSKEALLFLINGDFSVFTELLKHEDPKIRKNTASILGLLGSDDNVDALYEAYTVETTMYNKAAYIEALRRLHFQKYTEDLKKRFESLKKEKITVENKKHIIEEVNQLKKIFGTGKKEFTGYNLLNNVLLTTNRNFKNITADAVADIPHSEFAAGVKVRTSDLKKILSIRTYDEILFIPDRVNTVSNDPVKAAKELVDQGIKDYIFERIGILNENGRVTGGMTVNFRSELRAKDKFAYPDFTKKISAELETLTNWELVNSVSNYDLELRFIPNSNGKLNVLIKFFILKDVRFSYRHEILPVCMRPYLAATLMQLAKPYFVKNAAILDPFCGTGTLLAEREAAGSSTARIYYGIDIFKEAVEKTSENLKSFGMLRKTELINKDFFTFEHEYKFDEIITDMPVVTEKKTLRDIEEIYAKFFEKCDSLLEKKGVMIVYSRNPEFVKKFYAKSGCSMNEDFEISKIENSHLFILTRQ
ncbi:MAG: methyltransferase domain-containing protein [Lachnospiraceae bacterium]|nr:methyltransferase domain-containing protein [Lachnospiraceae bacterium]